MLLNPQRLNRYVYGLNNPYKYVDPDGEFALLGAALIGAAVAYLSSPDVANAPESSSAPTYESHGERSIVAGAVGGAGVRGTAMLMSASNQAPRGRHHTSPNRLNQIKKDKAIKPSRGGGVHVETEPFGPAGTASKDTGAFRNGAYVEFDIPGTIRSTNVGPRNTGVIPTKKPLSIGESNPKFVKLPWWKR
ncbi:MAG: hypothetical protein D3910_00155 [Candidatus Electrothrix sp. ATG2]|nr:hypothetical protein [Candidatus Electrothrix sp. ATG2]